MRNILSTIAAIFAFATFSFGADVAFTIIRADVSCKLTDEVPQADKLQFALDQAFNEDELIPCEKPGLKECVDKRQALKEWIESTIKNKANYHLLQIETGALTLMDNVDAGGALDNTIRFNLPVTYDLSKGYILVAKNLTQGKKVPVMIKVEQDSSCEAKPTDLPEREKRESEKEGEEDQKDKKIEDYITKPKIEESPALKLDFALQGAKHQQSIYSFNVKFRPYTTRRLGFGGHYDLTWFFLDTEYKINAKKGDKKNTLNVGVFDFNWTKVWRDDGDERVSSFFKVFPAVILSVTPKLETEWRFEKRNLLLSPKVTVPINIYQSRGATVQINPFGGIDMGYRWKGDEQRRGWNIIRPFFGAALTANFLRKADKPRLSFQIDYIRRVFAKPELSHGFNADGDVIPDQSTRTPRDYGKMRFVYNATELLSPFIEYEYGWVPPEYSLLNSSFKTGIVFDVDILWKTFRR